MEATVDRQAAGRTLLNFVSRRLTAKSGVTMRAFRKSASPGRGERVSSRYDVLDRFDLLFAVCLLEQFRPSSRAPCSPASAGGPLRQQGALAGPPQMPGVGRHRPSVSPHRPVIGVVSLERSRQDGVVARTFGQIAGNPLGTTYADRRALADARVHKPLQTRDLRSCGRGIGFNRRQRWLRG